MRNLLVGLLALTIVSATSVGFGCGGGAPVTMTVQTVTTFEAVPNTFWPPTTETGGPSLTHEGGCTTEIM